MKWLTFSVPYHELGKIDGETVVFEWKIFPKHTALKPLREVQNMTEKEVHVLPKNCKKSYHLHVDVQRHRIGAKKTMKEIRKRNCSSVAEYAKDFSDIGHHPTWI